MNKTIKTIIAACLSAPLLTGCLEETFPSSGMTQKQVNNSSEALGTLNNALARQMMILGSDYSSIGYPGIMYCLDIAAGNLPVVATGYDYCPWYANDTYMGETGLTIIDWWAMYSNLIHNANIVIESAPNSSEATTEELGYMGNALAYRAMAYLDMVRLYEYKHTGEPDLDNQAESAGIYKLTVPLVTENTTEVESRNNPRQPFYVIYRYILNDLNHAEIYLQGTNYTEYKMADIATIYGLKARLWLEIGSRFDKYPEDLQTALSHESDAELAEYAMLDVKSAEDCFANAAKYARMAINEGGTPITEEQWYDTKTGFNTGNSAWLWAVQIRQDDISSYTWAYLSFVGFMALEADFGVACMQYNAGRMIDARLYSTIDDNDWRKHTWIDPNDAGNTNAKSKYSTTLTDDEWANAAPYLGLKFRPGSGDRSNYLNGVAVDIPLMRIEEMYLIEAEALAHSQGLTAGIRALESFLNRYRYSSATYSCDAWTIEEFADEILRQKRIEFWGEGITAFDFKRLEKAVVKDYTGSNHTDSYQSHTKEGYVAPRFNVCFPLEETLYNSGVVNNPNPSGYPKTNN